MKTLLPTEGVLPRTQRLDRVPPVQAARLLRGTCLEFGCDGNRRTDGQL